MSRGCWFILGVLLIGARAVSAQDEQPEQEPQQQQQQRGLIGINWGTQLSHPLYPPDVITMLKANNIFRVKLFEADLKIMTALAGSHLEVMLGIPNDMLERLATSLDAAHEWVLQNVTTFFRRSKRVNIRYVAVGNEPFLTAYNKTFEGITLPALKNIQAALSKAKLANDIKATIPLNADVLQPSDPNNPVPSGGVFRADIKLLMQDIVQALASTRSPFTINLYPYISLYQDPNFPVEFAFMDGNIQLVDGPNIYTSVFDASFDMLVAALKDSGYPDMEIIVGEAGWPTDAATSANPSNARRYNQGLVNRILSNRGTPLRPSSVLHVYIFSLIDEDLKSIAPGNFERHWGVFTYDGQAKYPLDTSGMGDFNATLKNVPGVQYQPPRWCVLRPERAAPADQIDFACSKADCTSLTPDFGSCSSLGPEAKASYAFNSYYQLNDQTGCDFAGNGIVTGTDPSSQTCRFDLQVRFKSGAAGYQAEKLAAMTFILAIVFTIIL